MPNYIVILFLSGLITVACSTASKNPPVTTVTDSVDYYDAFTTLIIDSISIDIISPPGTITGDILVLPGWNFSRSDWCMKSDMCRQALDRGYRLVMPEMGKSIYAREWYKETRSDWKKFPTGRWLTDTLLKKLGSEFGVLVPGSKNYILGLSTGARGVALTVINTPKVFKAAAALSGDYDQTQMPGDNLVKGYYGKFDQFPERWKLVDNPVTQAGKFNIPVYLGHGADDKMIPPSQTDRFYRSLIAAHPQLTVVLNIKPGAGHDYAYWGSETKPVLDFFQNYP